MTKEEKKLHKLVVNMKLLSEGGREYIRQISQVLFAVQDSMVSPIPQENISNPEKGNWKKE
jgi:hypothetical protein